MKLLVIGRMERVMRYIPDMEITQRVQIASVSETASVSEILAAGRDADFVLADACFGICGEAIRGMPNLKLIQSEGVAFDKIDLKAAVESGVRVCNCKGVNAAPVAEVTVLLMLALIKNIREGDIAVRQGRQMQTKEAMLMGGYGELSGKRVGLYGFGDIGKEVAVRLNAFGCDVYYYDIFRASAETEQKYGVTYVSEQDLISTSEILSLHAPVTEETRNLIRAETIAKMRRGVIIVNTARGELVNGADLRDALIQGKVAGAAFDTISPEPVTKDNPLVDLPESILPKVFYLPHIGGGTEGTLRRIYRTLWTNIERISQGLNPIHCVSHRC